MINVIKPRHFVRLQVISIIGAALSFLYQESSLWSLPVNVGTFLWIAGGFVVGGYYIWAIAMYYRRWYAYIVSPIFLTLYLFVISYIWTYVTVWLGNQPQDDPADGLALLVTLVGTGIGVIVGSAVGTAIGLYIESTKINKSFNIKQPR